MMSQDPDYILSDLNDKTTQSEINFSQPVPQPIRAVSSKYPKKIKSKMTNHMGSTFDLAKNNHHSHQRMSKYHYHLKVDKIYGDKKLKLCGQCIAPNNLSRDLKQLGKFTKNPDLKESVTLTENQENHSYLATIRSIDYDADAKIDFEVLDLTAERQSGLNLPIIYLPAELFRFKQLRRLHLDGNQIRSIPDLLGENLINLEVLTISSNSLQYLPDSLSNLTKLQSLHLSNNHFQYFPYVVCNIPTLKFLDLSSNELEEISSELGELRNLETLLLFQNHLKGLPESIGNLVKLRTLWLGNNRITHLPKEMINLKSLEWDNQSFNLSTNIEGNPLTEPPYEICIKGMPAIKEYFQAKQPKQKKDNKNANNKNKNVNGNSNDYKQNDNDNSKKKL